MSKSKTPKLKLRGIRPVEQIFHNERIKVYPTTARFDEITFWPENARTQLDFDLLEQEKKKPVIQLSIDEITEELAQKPALKLSSLAASIKRNGVRVPLIILDDGTLLDGNRRFFACSFLNKRAKENDEPRPLVLNRIPVWVIKAKTLNERKRTKILAEANFVTDLKLDWPLSVKARLVTQLFERCIKKEKKTPEAAYQEILDLYAVDPVTAKAYIETVSLTEEFINSSGPNESNRYRIIVQDRFVYFWEFRNKALAGTNALDETELSKVEPLFFKMMANNRFKNLKQIEPMIRSVRDEDQWELLTKSGGSKIDQVEAIYRERKAIRSAEDKIRNFYKWLQKVDRTSFTSAARELLRDLRLLCQNTLSH
jgi:hypothetical protein